MNYMRREPLSAELYPDVVGVKFQPLRLIYLYYRSSTLEAHPPSRRLILIWLIVSQVLALASLFFWLLMAGLSVMAFDSGVTQEAWNFVIAVWLYPIWPIVFAVAAWVAYARYEVIFRALLPAYISASFF
jgi:hypothetical protein